MARADLILGLARAAVRGDLPQVRKTIEALAAEERAKDHVILADRLMAQVQQEGNGRATAPAAIGQRPGTGPVVVELVPRRALEDLVLEARTSQSVRELVEEQCRADLLRAHGLEPRHRVLLAGPPGNGKTTLAEAIAEALSVPFLVVRYEAVIGSYLGETAQRIASAFEQARSRNCVLFFDEFDAVGKERGDLHETGEIKRVVSSILLQIDALPSYVVVVVASNHPELLDRAVWRRFQLRLELPMPTQPQIEQWLGRFWRRLKRPPKVPVRAIARTLKGLSFGEVEEFADDVMRRIALGEPGADVDQIVASRQEHWRARFTPKALKEDD